MVTSVNTVLQQCTGKVVRLNIQFEITYSTTVVGWNDAILSVRVLRQKQRDISLTDNWSRGSALTLLVVRKLDCKTYNWRFKTTEVMSKETYLLNVFLASQFVRKFQNDHLQHYRYSVLVSFEVWYITLLLPHLYVRVYS